jgi:hypothetical protein
MPRERLPMNPLARLSLERMLPPGTLTPAPALPAELLEDMARERRTFWPNSAPDISVPFDLRGSRVAIGAGASVLIQYRLPHGREGVVKLYGVGYSDTSLIPAPGAALTFTLAVDGSPITPDEGIVGSFPIFSNSEQDSDLSNLTRAIKGGETLTVTVVNGSGVALDLWARVVGWHY